MSTASELPARRIDAAGRVRVDGRAVLALALPLVANSAVQLVLGLTDMWFIGHISTEALAGVGAVHWLVLVVVFILGGVGMAVQTIVAQAFGAGRRAHASHAVWIALWCTLLAVPLFIAVALAGGPMVALFGLPAEIRDLSVEFWLPRVAGAPFGAAVWAVLGFFNGIGRPKVTLGVTAIMAIANVFLNQYFVFHLGLGVAGSAYATTVAQIVGLALVMWVFLGRRYRERYAAHRTWRPQWSRIGEQLRLGFPMGLLSAADLLGFAIFQVMQVRLGAVDGAATQVVMVLTSLAYMPGLGIALAGTTLVGQAIGAGDRAWAFRLGNRIIAMAALYMGAAGLLLALLGPWLLPFFTASHDTSSAEVIALGSKLLWFATVYQFFDGLNMGSSFCLRGAGDVFVPALLVILLSWCGFVPFAHMLSFAPGQGWVDFLPQLGWGALGGWVAVVIYIMLLGLMLLARWRVRAWERLHVEV